MANLGSLVIQMAVDTAKFQGDLGRAAAIAESRMRNIRDTAQKTVAQLAAIGTAVGGALIVATKQGIDAADSMRDMAAAAGVSVENMSRLGYAAQKSGTDLETLKKALAKLSKEGAKDSVAALMTLADEFAALPNGAEKTARAIELFGERIGPNLVPLLNEGRDGLQDLGAEADALGVTISTRTAAAADQFNDSMAALGGVVTGFKNSLSGALLPTLNTLAKEMVSVAKNSDAMDKAVRAAATGLKLLLTGAEITRLVFQQIGEGFGAVAAAIVTAAQGNFRQAWSILKMSAQDGQAQVQSSITRILDLWDEAGSDVVGKAAPFTAEIEKIGKAAKASEKEVLSWGEAVNRALSDIDIDARNDVARGMAQISNETRSMTTVIEGAAKPISQMSVFAEEAARNMQDAFAGFFYNFDGGLKGMVAGFADTLRQMVAELAAQELLRAFFTWGAGTFGGSIGTFFSGLGAGITGKAVGGPVTAGGTYLVGENGPELLRMGASTNGMVIPNHAVGGGNVNVNYTIDARGADAERIMAILPGMLRQTEQRTIAAVLQMQRQGRLA